MSQAKISLIPLMLKQYQDWLPELAPNQEPFIKSAMDLLGRFGVVKGHRICVTRDEVDAAVANAEAECSDIIVILFAAYAPSLMSFPALTRTRLPILILNSTPGEEFGDDFQVKDYLENHGIHGVQDLANVLNRAGKSHWIASGHLSDAKLCAQVEDYIALARVKSAWEKIRVGRLGSVIQDMGDLAVDITMMLNSGPHVIDIAPGEFLKACKAVSPEEIKALVEIYRSEYETDNAGEEVLAATAEAEAALRKIITDNKLDAIAFSFMIFEHLHDQVMPFVGISRLMSEGIGYGGEADIIAAASVRLLNQLIGCAGFTEMFCPDWKHDQILMSHMGEMNPSFARNKPKMIAKPSLIGGNGSTGVLLFDIEPGPATLASLTIGADSKLCWVIAEGEIEDTIPFKGLDAPHYIFEPDIALPDFLTAYSQASGSHHMVICKGRVTEKIAAFAQMIDTDCIIIEDTDN